MKRTQCGISCTAGSVCFRAITFGARLLRDWARCFVITTLCSGGSQLLFATHPRTETPSDVVLVGCVWNGTRWECWTALLPSSVRVWQSTRLSRCWTYATTRSATTAQLNWGERSAVTPSSARWVRGCQPPAELAVNGNCCLQIYAGITLAC